MGKIFFAVLTVWGHLALASLPMDQLIDRSERIQIENLKAWPLLHNGRVKPFETFAQEVSLFITGKYKFKGLHPIQFVLGSMGHPHIEDVDVIEVRSPELRTQLGLPDGRRHFSMAELKKTNLQALATPILEKEKANRRSLNEIERKTLEAMEQMWAFEQVASGSLLMGAMSPQLQSPDHGKAPASTPDPGFNPLLGTLVQSADRGAAFEFNQAANDIKTKLIQQPWPESVKAQVGNMDLEVLYNSFRPFSIACWLFFLSTVLLLQGTWILKIKEPLRNFLLLIPIVVLIIGFAIRIRITSFAPVTNMYGTMMWVALGVGLFGWIFNLIYKNLKMLSLIYFGSFVLLLLTEQIPLIISPDMDPIVAVLRSNLWLTIHVLTITISYAAFTIAMLIGNATMIRLLMGKDMSAWLPESSHICYRAIQLGVFLLSIGIILGGVWADYSWGRFWGWDPKETWALIADLGFLVLLHARFVGWVNPFRLLILAPVAYLLVIMAWYGVNFILATGLHSYGFSSGGAKIVVGFLAIQMVLFVATLAYKWTRAPA